MREQEEALVKAEAICWMQEEQEGAPRLRADCDIDLTFCFVKSSFSRIERKHSAQGGWGLSAQGHHGRR